MWRTDADYPVASHDEATMAPTYAVIWQEPGFPQYAGKLVVGRRQLSLEGSATGARQSLHRVLYDEIARVRVGRAPGERLDGRSAVVLERRQGGPLRIATVNGIGETSELADQIAVRVPGGLTE